MSNVLEIPDAGFVTVKLGDAQVQLDAYEAWNTVRSLRDATEDAGEPVQAFHARVVEYLASKGLPRLSHFQADLLVKRLAEAVTALKKTADPTPASPPSTAPASSPCPPA